MEKRLVVVSGVMAVLLAGFIGWLVAVAMFGSAGNDVTEGKYERLIIKYEKGDNRRQPTVDEEMPDKDTGAKSVDVGKKMPDSGVENEPAGDGGEASFFSHNEDEQMATRNLSVSVINVEPGPYDYHDKTPTVRVTVRMRNTSGHVIYVKPSNWDADTKDGRRVDHKLFVEDEAGNRDVGSFLPTSISPGSSFDGVLYFDGAELEAVLYEPHWLLSSEDELVRFEVS